MEWFDWGSGTIHSIYFISLKAVPNFWHKLKNGGGGEGVELFVNKPRKHFSRELEKTLGEEMGTQKNKQKNPHGYCG